MEPALGHLALQTYMRYLFSSCPINLGVYTYFLPLYSPLIPNLYFNQHPALGLPWVSQVNLG